MIISNVETNSEVPQEVTGFFNSMKNFISSLFCSDKKEVATSKVERHPESTAFITKEKKYLDQYYALRHEICKDENGWESYNGSENDFDKAGEIIVILDKEKKVVGGARFMVSGAMKYLYSEVPNSEFTYENVFKKAGADSSTFKYAEISSFVVDATYRDRVGTEKMLGALISEALKKGCEYLIAVSFLSRCRNYRIVADKLGYKMQIMTDYPWIKKEIYNYIDTFPMISKIR